MNDLTLTQAEAGILFSALVSFSDDDISEEEGIVLRKYYRYETAEKLQEKMETAGYEYPADLEKLEPVIADTLKASNRVFQLRTLAIGIELARADGNYDQSEMAILNRYATLFGLSLGEAGDFGSKYLVEIDENEKYIDPETDVKVLDQLSLTVQEAAIALSVLVAFSDDDPSESELGVMREYFTETDVESLQKKMTDAGKTYPEDLLSLKDDIQKAFLETERSVQLRFLAIAYKVAAADGEVEEEELELIQGLCEEFGIGLTELINYFKAYPA